MKFEPGVVTAHPIVYAMKHILTIWRTWMFRRKYGLPCNRWVGVYEAGTENVVAMLGPGIEGGPAEILAHKITRALSEDRKEVEG